MMTTTTRICLAVAAVLSSATGSGCALPVIEGIFDSRDFAIFDDTPEARGQSGEQVLLVFLEMNDADNTLRTVSIDMQNMADLPVDEAIEVGSGGFGDVRPNVEVVEGSIVRDILQSGEELISTGDDAKRAVSVEGTVTLEQNDADAVVGTFLVDLDDGGYLAGSFTSSN